jgi:hypothetical protein
MKNWHVTFFRLPASGVEMVNVTGILSGEKLLADRSVSRHCNC